MPKDHKKRILVIGGAGYIGSAMIPFLLENNYKVRIFDNFTFGSKSMQQYFDNPDIEIVHGDIQQIASIEGALQYVDGVIHLAGLANDPSCDLDFSKSIKINYVSNVVIAKLCNEFKISRFIFSSSCSVYGAADGIVNETSPKNPLTIYAESKARSEEVIFDLMDANFSPCCLRLSTVFGKSPRQRFDLVINILTAHAYNNKKIVINGGNQWRPNVHVKDVARAFLTVLQAPIEKVRGEIFNVGSNDLNTKIIDLGNKVKTVYPDVEMVVNKNDIDERSYRVNFDKITNVLGYTTSMTIEDGIKELLDAFKNGEFKNYTDSIYYNVRHILERGF